MAKEVERSTVGKRGEEAHPLLDIRLDTAQVWTKESLNERLALYCLMLDETG